MTDTQYLYEHAERYSEDDLLEFAWNYFEDNVDDEVIGWEGRYYEFEELVQNNKIEEIYDLDLQDIRMYIETYFKDQKDGDMYQNYITH